MPTLMLAPFTPSHRHAVTGVRESSPACLSLIARGSHVTRFHIISAIYPVLIGGWFQRAMRHVKLLVANATRLGRKKNPASRADASPPTP